MNLDRKSQGLVEYAIALVLIAAVSLTILRLLGTQTNKTYSIVNSKLASEAPADSGGKG